MVLFGLRSFQVLAEWCITRDDGIVPSTIHMTAKVIQKLGELQEAMKSSKGNGKKTSGKVGRPGA